MEETWTVKRCLDWTNGYLESKGIENPRISAEWLLSSVTGLKRIQLYTDFAKPLSPDELSRMHEAVVRRAKGEPLQYIVGNTAFRAIEVACEPGVLIPRPETEMLVEEVLTYLDREVIGEMGRPGAVKRAPLPWNAEVEAAREAERAAAAEAARAAASEAGDVASADAETGEGADAADETEAPEAESDDKKAPEPDAEPRVSHVLEVGCGTGCISLSLALERPGRVTCIATDIEPRAVALAIRNRDALGIAPEVVDFREGNLVAPLDRQTEWGTFDVLVSNPPYIPTSVMRILPDEVARFEPHLALEGGEDGLDIFRRLVNAAPSMLRAGGLLACELHETTLDAAADICRAAGFEDVRIARDLPGRPRFILARVPEAVVAAARARFAQR
ncbi:N5-glutamine methyltransferase family protein [Collinsella tanakaei]|uniref:N5-glutamine methyltransferase family protein n=1 Tax=Collinsella tanakaei TaxID=626935 RepID=UPI0025A471DF|nr:HemK/PrmC family methyltransferase [Collinsella tanakaei]MDM8300958.1 HemK/PrmC family methyltransferase [Collinsella tanakaei]